MKNDSEKFIGLLVRYLILVIVALLGFDLFYFVFLPLTKYPVFYLLEFFYDPAMFRDTIVVLGKNIQIVGACVAGSAYYFLLMLNLSTSKIKVVKRLKMIGFSFLVFWGINILRIFVLSVMYVNESNLFDFAHKLFWYLGSTIFIIVIWFVQVKRNKIKSIPFYSDLKFIYGKSVFGK